MSTPTVSNVSVKCGHCPTICIGENALYDHLIKTHRYPEEDAGSYAARLARRAVCEADPEWATYLRLDAKFRMLL